MIAFIILLLVNVYILAITQEPRELVEIKEKYEILRKHITDTDHQKFHMLRRCIPITGVTAYMGSFIGVPSLISLADSILLKFSVPVG
jgi:hypothetical protein